MNKQERKLKGIYKFKKRLKNFRLTGQKYYSLKTTGKPCSCILCSPPKHVIKPSVVKRKDSCDTADQVDEYFAEQHYWEEYIRVHGYE